MWTFNWGVFWAFAAVLAVRGCYRAATIRFGRIDQARHEALLKALELIRADMRGIAEIFLQSKDQSGGK